MGRPKLPIDLGQVRVLAGVGCTQGQIAAALNMTRRTFERRLATDSELREALEIGAGKGEVSILQKQFEKAMKGDTTMLIFLGKVRCGQVEPSRLELTGRNGGAVEVKDVSAEKRLAGLLDRVAARIAEERNSEGSS